MIKYGVTNFNFYNRGKMEEFKSFFKDVGGNEGDVCLYNTRLDTYGCGCQHDCSYCYAKSLLSFRQLWKPESPSVSDTQDIRRQIKKLKRGSVVRLGGMTDCFQPIEKTYRATYRAINMLNRKGVEYLIITKSHIIADDEYLRIMDKDLAHIQFTLTFTDDSQYKAAGIEKASLPSQRIKAIEKLYEQGFDVSIRLSPYIPEYIDIEKLNAIKCDKVLVEFLRVNHWIRKWLAGKCDLSGYTKTFHGYDHLPFSTKRRLVEEMGNAHTITVCDFEPERLEYWKKEFNPNPDDCCNLRRETNGKETTG